MTAAPAASAAPASWRYVGAAGVVAILWFSLLPLRPLFNPDEGRYAEIPREMLAADQWVIPQLNGLAYVEKPPLQYWVTAAALRVFGDGEFAARFYIAVCAWGTLATGWAAAAALWGAAAAWRAAAVLSSMLLFVVLGQLLTLDMSLTLYTTLSLTAFLMAQRPPPAERNADPRRWMLLAWTAAALGVLTKGLVAAVIPAAVLVLYSLVARDYSPWRRLHAGWGLPLFLAITVPWHWLAAARLPGFLQFFFVHEHFGRYLTPAADREEAWWFFPAVFALGSIPWTWSAGRVFATGWRRGPRGGPFDPHLFLWLWVVFVGVFFSLSDSKLIPYVLPAMPALALLIGASPDRALARDLRATGVFTLLAAVGVAAAGMHGTGFGAPPERAAYFAQLARPLLQIAALLGLIGLSVLWRRRRDITRDAVVLGVGWCLAGLLLMRAAALVAPVYSGASLARAITPPPPAVPVYSVGTYDQTLPFYWRHTIKLVRYRGELDFGLQRRPAAEIPSIAQFIAEWRAQTAGYAVMENDMFDDLVKQGVPMREIARNVRHVLVARR